MAEKAKHRKNEIVLLLQHLGELTSQLPRRSAQEVPGQVRAQEVQGER